MRLLIVTQTVDTKDTRLSFFHAWIKKIAGHFDAVEVICLYEGTHTLPSNVIVHSLGKEKGSASKLQYSLRFLRLIWRLRNRYDRVFVHMNQEYVLLGGLFWKALGKNVYLWRNHYAGSFLTRMAVWFSTRVFCTSVHSYTARFTKTTLMPVGVELELFTRASAERKENTILFFGRMTPSKRPDLLIEALILLAKEGTPFTATFCGPVLREHTAYVYALKKRITENSLEDSVVFLDGIPHAQTPQLYAEHDVYVNLGASGMFDKTLFEASASGCLVVATSDDFQKRLGESHPITSETPEGLASSLEWLLTLSPDEKAHLRAELRKTAEKESLDALISAVSSAILA